MLSITKFKIMQDVYDVFLSINVNQLQKIVIKLCSDTPMMLFSLFTMSS